jgi:ABC-type lipoprotein export system ATPase subunit
VVDSQAWLAMLDGVGIVTDRAVLIGQFSVEQNAAMPYTLQIDPVAAEFKARVAQLVEEVGLSRADLDTRVGDARPEVQARVRLARALALEPSLLLLEHPSALLPRDAVKAFAADVSRVAVARGLGVLTITADDLLARGLGGKNLTLEPATGVLRSAGGWRKLFG